ncbi:hypothetical protein WA026_001203 [Henosepilachna vigintioctopunctata]|uniref:Heat shock protein 70 n=1 Tax=Henosepilachna vigintioctopunctata TaxID=420089 RepID=A0AAW1UP86_9CUCU
MYEQTSDIQIELCNFLSKCNEVIAWLDANQRADEEEYEHKQKELEGICNPIIRKLVPKCRRSSWRNARCVGGVPGGMPGGMSGGFQGTGGAGPTIEEVD